MLPQGVGVMGQVLSLVTRRWTSPGKDGVKGLSEGPCFPLPSLCKPLKALLGRLLEDRDGHRLPTPPRGTSLLPTLLSPEPL